VFSTLIVNAGRCAAPDVASRTPVSGAMTPPGFLAVVVVGAEAAVLVVSPAAWLLPLPPKSAMPAVSPTTTTATAATICVRRS